MAARGLVHAVGGARGRGGTAAARRVLKTPPYRIVTERLVVRCWEPADAPLFKRAVDASLDHLRPWMPWALREPEPLAAKVDLLRRFRGQFDLGEDFVYGIFTRDENAVAGGTGLHTRRGEGAFEIGYWIAADLAGRGLATEVTAALTRVAFEVCEVERVEIRVDPANAASIAIPRRLGFVEEGTLRKVLHGPDGTPRQRDAVVFALVRDEFGGSPASAAALEAFDAAGGRVL
ncbi:MAG TPA: GNAT family protein [Gaiellaceae bacterium]|nr:GNAT family protein [Gaiellaceae bacterium]